MGTFLGHALPGLIFFLLGGWWMLQIFRRVFSKRSDTLAFSTTGRTTNACTFKGAPFYPVDICCRTQVQLDCIFGSLVCLFGAVAHCTVSGAANLQHATMYAFFLLPCVASLLLPRVRIVTAPDRLVYVLLAIAYMAEGLLFKFHLHDRTELDVLIHTLLIYTIFATAGTVLLEMVYPQSILLSLVRAGLTILQGTWFFQVAFTLYPLRGSAWSDVKDPEDMLLVACYFAWHAGAVLLVTLMSGTFFGYYYKLCYRTRGTELTPADETAYHQCDTFQADEGSTLIHEVDEEI